MMGLEVLEMELKAIECKKVCDEAKHNAGFKRERWQQAFEQSKDQVQ